MSKTDTMSKTGKFCPFQPPLVDIYDSLDGREPVTEYQWQKCGEACALYSTKLQDCVIGTIADRLEDTVEQLSDIADSIAVMEERIR